MTIPRPRSVATARSFGLNQAQRLADERRQRVGEGAVDEAALDLAAAVEARGHAVAERDSVGDRDAAGKREPELGRLLVPVRTDLDERRELLAVEQAAVLADHVEAPVVGHAEGLDANFIAAGERHALHGRDVDPRDAGGHRPQCCMARTQHPDLSETDSTVPCRAPRRRPLRSPLHRPAERRPAGVDAAADLQVRRLGARARRRRRVQAAELDDAADRDRGGRRDHSSCGSAREDGGLPRDPPAPRSQRRLARDGRGGGPREGRRRARPAAACSPTGRTRSARSCGWSGASGRPTSGRST